MLVGDCERWNDALCFVCVMVGGGLCFCSRRFGLEGLSSSEFLKITVVPLPVRPSRGPTLVCY
ncbi:hypothetical protein Hanom_Chr17g01536221 [Helianthus anomalus]